MALDSRRFCRIICVGTLALTVIAALFIYFHYPELKKSALSHLSDRATVLLGQRVDIGDASFSPAVGINLYDISIENPEDFGAGRLLFVKRVHASIRIRELFRGMLSVKDITVYSPVLNAKKNRKGSWNIAYRPSPERRRKSEFAYRADRISIVSGRCNFLGEFSYSVNDINMTLKNLSSSSGGKTLIRAHAFLPDRNGISIDGWANLAEEPRKFNISVSSENFRLSAFKDYLDAYMIDTEQPRVSMNLKAAGDSDSGITIQARVMVEKPSVYFLEDDVFGARADMDAFYDFRKGLAAIKNFSLHFGKDSVIRMRGLVKNLQESPAYDAEVDIVRLNLSALKVMKESRAAGIMTSEKLRIRGNFDKALPAISGTVHLRDVSVISDSTSFERVNADLHFLPEREISLQAETTALALRMGGYGFSPPAELRLSARAVKKTGKITFASAFNLSPVSINIKEGKPAVLKNVNLMVDGTAEKGTFTGSCSLRTEGMRYGDQTVEWLAGVFDMDYRLTTVTMKGLKLETEDGVLSAGRINIEIPGERREVHIEMKDIKGAYPSRELELQKIDISTTLETGKETLAGDFFFSAGKILFRDIASEINSGSARFDGRRFFLDIQNAVIAGGNIKLSAQGRDFQAPFPVRVDMKARNLSLEVMSRIAEMFVEVPFSLSGIIQNADFMGTIESPESIRGRASVLAENIVVANKETMRNLMKDLSVKTELLFTDRDVELKTDAAVRGVSAGMYGKGKEFAGKERLFQITLTVPETKIEDIRNSFWDIFPDSLLYTGLTGNMSSKALVHYSGGDLKISGDVRVTDFIVEGENGEYTVGPVNGTVPIAYRRNVENHAALNMPSIERSDFEKLKKYYSERTGEDSYSRVTIGSFRYGFRLMEDVEIWIKQKEGILNIGRFSGNIFGGRLYGSGVIDFSDKLSYSAEVLLDRMSLARLCDNIEPIKGYISGKVDGIAQFKGAGTGIADLIGKADLWTYGDRTEETRISRKFLQKIGGPSIKSYLGDRNFDKGIMSVYMKKGYLIFRELEISNRNFIGITDLSVKVAPLSNRVEISHLLWTLIEAAERAKKSKK